MGTGDATFRPGQVARIRVSPKDCMAVIDICNVLGINMRNMSFAQVTKIALASCLESMRQNNVIPTRDGFEYSEMMAPFKENMYAQHGAKLAVTKLVDGIGEQFQPQPIVPQSDDMRRVKARMDELATKREHDPINFTHEDQVEWEQLTAQLFQE